MSENINNLTEQTFDEELGSAELPILVDFWAEWCGPCKAVAPVLEKLAKDQAANLRIAKVDVDAQPGLARRFDVMSIPTMILFRDGKAVHKIVGAKGEGQLLADLAPHL
jgi:thioredoxin 1